MHERDRDTTPGVRSAEELLAQFRVGDVGFLVVLGVLASLAAGWLYARGSGSGGILEILKGSSFAAICIGVFSAVAVGSSRRDRGKSRVPLVAASILAGAFVAVLFMAGTLWD